MVLEKQEKLLTSQKPLRQLTIFQVEEVPARLPQSQCNAQKNPKSNSDPEDPTEHV